MMCTKKHIESIMQDQKGLYQRRKCREDRNIALGLDTVNVDEAPQGWKPESERKMKRVMTRGNTVDIDGHDTYDMCSQQSEMSSRPSELGMRRGSADSVVDN